MYKIKVVWPTLLKVQYILNHTKYIKKSLYLSPVKIKVFVKFKYKIIVIWLITKTSEFFIFVHFSFLLYISSKIFNIISHYMVFKTLQKITWIQWKIKELKAKNYSNGLLVHKRYYVVLRPDYFAFLITEYFAYLLNVVESK